MKILLTYPCENFHAINFFRTKIVWVYLYPNEVFFFNGRLLFVGCLLRRKQNLHQKLCWYNKN